MRGEGLTRWQRVQRVRDATSKRGSNKRTNFSSNDGTEISHSAVEQLDSRLCKTHTDMHGVPKMEFFEPKLCSTTKPVDRRFAFFKKQNFEKTRSCAGAMTFPFCRADCIAWLLDDERGESEGASDAGWYFLVREVMPTSVAIINQ